MPTRHCDLPQSPPQPIRLWLMALAIVVFCFGCGATPKPPPQTLLRASQPDLNAILWWLPPETQTLTIVQGPFEIQPIDARPNPTFTDISHALCLTLLRNLDNGRFLAGWTQISLSLAVDLRTKPLPDAQPSAQILVFQDPIPDRDWQSIEGAAADASVFEGTTLLRLTPTIRGRAWPIWLARLTPHILILSDHLPLLHSVLSLRLNPAERALNPDHPAWQNLPSSPNTAWSIHVTDDATTWTDLSTPTPTLACDPSDRCESPQNLSTDNEILVFLRALGYWIPL